MGIFDLDLSKPLQLEIKNCREKYAAIIERYLHSWLTKAIHTFPVFSNNHYHNYNRIVTQRQSV